MITFTISEEDWIWLREFTELGFSAWNMPDFRDWFREPGKDDPEDCAKTRLMVKRIGSLVKQIEEENGIKTVYDIPEEGDETYDYDFTEEDDETIAAVFFARIERRSQCLT